MIVSDVAFYLMMEVVVVMMHSYQDKYEYSSLVGKEVKGIIPGSFINTLSKACGTLFRTFFKISSLQELWRVRCLGTWKHVLLMSDC